MPRNAATRRIGLAMLAWAFVASVVSAQTNAAPRPEQFPLTKVAENRFKIGLVQFDKAARTITLPAEVNMRENNVEYVLVSAAGKTHESVFRTAAEPQHIQIAMLLLGGRPALTNAFPNDFGAPLPGETVQLRVSQSGKARPIEDYVLDRSTKKSLSRGPWIFNGSRIGEGTFVAQRDGSIVSLMSDPDALINNPRPDREQDDLWTPNARLLPPVGSPVDIIIQLQTATSTNTVARPARRR